MATKLASDEYLRLKKEVSRMASMANKRLRRLESNDLTNLPAYQAWERNGSIKFSVKGKDYNQLQSEYWRLKGFLDARTSTVREANKFLREMAEDTGIKYHGLADLKEKSKQFFELADKIKEYYKKIDETAKAIDYRAIFEQINVMVEQGMAELGAEESTEEILNKFMEQMEKLEPVEEGQEGYKRGDTDWDFVRLT